MVSNQAMKNHNTFWYWIREREAIRNRRFALGEEGPWTEDPILREYRFCNVRREDDKTTAWYRKHVRNPLRNYEQVLMATLIFRMFNRIETGEILNRCFDWYVMADNFNVDDYPKQIAEVLRDELPNGPWVTGSYVISSLPGMPKLEGILEGLRRSREQINTIWDWLTMVPAHMRSLEQTTHVLSKHLTAVGPFIAYELVTDLRHTAWLDKSRDIMTWANPGPGAKRGINRLRGHGLRAPVSNQLAQDYMQQLLADAHDRGYGSFEMRDIEHCLCEVDKYLRVKNGEGAPRAKNSWRNSFDVQ